LLALWSRLYQCERLIDTKSALKLSSKNCTILNVFVEKKCRIDFQGFWGFVYRFSRGKSREDWWNAWENSIKIGANLESTISRFTAPHQIPESSTNIINKAGLMFPEASDVQTSVDVHSQRSFRKTQNMKLVSNASRRLWGRFDLFRLNLDLSLDFDWFPRNSLWIFCVNDELFLLTL
jgi:hypothetical protein